MLTRPLLLFTTRGAYIICVHVQVCSSSYSAQDLYSVVQLFYLDMSRTCARACAYGLFP